MMKGMDAAHEAGGRRFPRERRGPAYRAVTLGGERADWAVVDGRGTVVYRGDAKVAAMIANRLSRMVA